MPIYNPHDVVVIQRNSTSSSFVEEVLSSSPNSLLLFDSASHLISVSTQSVPIQVVSSSYSVSASWAPFIDNPNAVSASWASESFWAISASFSSQSIWTDSSSFASQSISSSYSINSNTASYITSSNIDGNMTALSSSWSSASLISVSSSWASQSLSASWAPFTDDPNAVSASWASSSFIALSASFASSSISSSSSITASWSPVPISASWSSASINSNVSISSSWASQSLSASWSPNQGATTLVTGSTYQITSSNSISSSWSSVPISSSWSSASLFTTSASFTSASSVSISSSWSSASLVATSASYASASTSASWALESISASSSVNANSASSIVAITSSVSSSYSVMFVTSSGTQTVYLDDQSGVFTYNPGTDILSVPSISASTAVYTVDPTTAQQVATKNYVDQLNPQGLDFYFRSASSDVSGYENMFRLTTPLSSSTPEIVVNNVSASQYFTKFISPALNLQNISQGTFNVHFHIYRTGGNAANTVAAELYIRSASVEYIELPAPSPIVITTNVNDSFTIPITNTSSIALNLTDRLVCKFKCINGTSTPNIHMTVDGGTAAGVSVPVPSSAFVLRTGDTMSGDLTSTGFTGSLFGTASWSSNSVSSSYSTGSVIGHGIFVVEYITSASYAALNPPLATTLYVISSST